MGAPAHEATLLLAALPALLTAVPRPIGSSLPRAARSMKGWLRLAPPAQRLPLPWVLICIIMAWFLRRGLRHHALALALQFCTYLRPGEVMSLRGSQLIPPTAAAGQAYTKWGINIGPLESGIPGKTGIFDESLMIDRMLWLNPWLKILKENAGDMDRVWPFPLHRHALLFARAVHDSGLQSLKPTLYAIRHGGASEDLLRGTRSLEAVFRRGRWRAWSSVRRYGKEAKLQAALAKLPVKLLDYGQTLEHTIAAAVLDPRLLPRLPRGMA